MKLKNLFSNPGPKALAILLAVIAYLIIMNVNDPVTVKKITNVPVTVTNASYVESMGSAYSLSSGYETVTVRIRGNRSKVEHLTAEDITVKADLTRIVSFNSNPIVVPLTLSAPDIDEQYMAAIPSTVQIELEELVSQDFVISCSTGGTEPAEGFDVAKLAAVNDKVTVTGPASLIGIIDRVEAPVDVTELSTDTSMKSSLVVFDKNGQVLSDSQMRALRFNIDASDVEVRVTLYRVVKDVVLELAGYDGSPASGFQVMGTEITPSTISVAGTEEALDTLEKNGNKITLPENLVDVGGKQTSFDTRLEGFGQYLPEGLILSSDATDVVIISTEILPYNSIFVKIPAAEIVKNNLSPDLAAVVSEASVSIAVTGPDKKLNKLKSEDIQASVDLTGLAEGNFEVPLAAVLPDGIEMLEDAVVHVTVSKIDEHQPQS